MKQRVISGVIIAAMIVVFGLLGGYPLAALLLVCSLIGYRELVSAVGIEGKEEKIGALAAAGYAMTILLYGGLMIMQARWGTDSKQMVSASNFYLLAVIIVSFLVMMTVYVFRFPKYRSEQVMSGYFCFIYAPVLLSFVYQARMLSYGIFMYALIFVCSSVCDTCALAAGMMFGKHKMAPVLSPKKTIEGAVGGVAGSAVCSVILSFVVKAFDPEAEKSRDQGLRKSDPRSRRDHGPVRQHYFYRAPDLHFGGITFRDGGTVNGSRKGRALCSPFLAYMAMRYNHFEQ